ncbi:MAG: hypothetical protein JWL66_1612 [Sphingomonadales bacterium]|nr:hypothetical protein [Sphingomonadales bacterium]
MSNAIEARGGREIEVQRLLPVKAEPEMQPTEDRLDLRSLLVTLQRRRGLILGVLATVMALAIAFTALQTPRYTAYSQIALVTTESRVPPGESGETKAPQSQDLADTEVEVLRSRELASTVARALKLDLDPRFNPNGSRQGGRLRRIGESIGLLASKPPVKMSPDAVRRSVVDQLLSGLNIMRVGSTYTFNISMTSAQPEDAQRIANEYAVQYTNLYLNRKRETNSEALTFLSKRLEELRNQAQADTARVQQYRIANNLLSTSGASLTEQEISSFNQQVAAARAQAVEDQARLSTARAQLRNGSKGDDVGEALNSSVVSGLRGQRAIVSARLASLEARYGSLYPDVQKAKSELADVDAQISAEINRVISNLEAKARVSGERLASIQGTLGGARAQLVTNNKAMVGLDDLTRRAEASQQLYDSYLARYKQTGAEEGTERPESRVISYADLPMAPTSPRVALNLILALVIGAGLSIASAFIAEMMFSGFTTELDVEQRLRTRCLGSIPLLKSVVPRGGPPIQSILDDPGSGFAEAFRSLRASINYAVDGRRQALMITSALPREGKTTTAICLARMSALGGERVVLVDVDVRQHGVSRLIRHADDRPGLIEVLRGEAELDAALIHDQESNAYILPIRETARDVGNLLIGMEMDALIVALRERFDLIVFDAAPILPIADTRSLAMKVDAIVLVARWRSTADHAIRAALRMLPHRYVPIAGVVLTLVDVRKQAKFGHGDGTSYYKKYRHYYA